MDRSCVCTRSGYLDSAYAQRFTIFGMHCGLVSALFYGRKCTGRTFYRGGQRGVSGTPGGGFFYFGRQTGST